MNNDSPSESRPEKSGEKTVYCKYCDIAYLSACAAGSWFDFVCPSCFGSRYGLLRDILEKNLNGGKCKQCPSYVKCLTVELGINTCTS
jgi:hypothetical protein